MKKLKNFAALSLLLTVFSFPVLADCDAGGPGSTSCSITKGGGGSGFGFGGNRSTTYSVSCGAGFYSCCNSTMFGGTASCVPAPSFAE